MGQGGRDVGDEFAAEGAVGGGDGGGRRLSEEATDRERGEGSVGEQGAACDRHDYSTTCLAL